MRKLYLDRTQLGLIEMKALIPLLKDLTNLQVLGLDQNQLDDAVMQTLGLCLKESPKLQKLWLQGNKISDTGVRVLEQYLNSMQGKEIILYFSNIKEETKIWLEEQCPGIR